MNRGRESLRHAKVLLNYRGREQLAGDKFIDDDSAGGKYGQHHAPNVVDGFSRARGVEAFNARYH